MGSTKIRVQGQELLDSGSGIRQPAQPCRGAQKTAGVCHGPCPAKVDRWCGLQVAYVLRLWQMSNQLDGVINLYLRAWPELASLHLNDMDRRIAQNHRSIWRVTDLKSVESWRDHPLHWQGASKLCNRNSIVNRIISGNRWKWEHFL